MYAWIRKEKKWITDNAVYITLLCVITAGFSFFYFTRFAPDTMGWQLYNSILMEDGKVVYKDFFNYLPPGSLIRTIWAYALSGGSIAGYRFICIMERVLLTFLIFKLLSRFYEAKYTWLAATTGMILTATTVVDQFGDYNQTYKLYLILGVFFGIKFFGVVGDKKKENIFLFIFGLCLGMVMLFKQSVGVIAPACFFLMLIIYCVVEKNKGFCRYALFAILGYLVPVGLCAAWLMQMDAFWPFVEEVIQSTAAKGDSSVLLLRFWNNIFKPDCIIILIPLVLLFIVEKLRRMSKININQEQLTCVRIVSISFTILFAFEKFGQYVGQFVGATKWTNSYWLFLAVILCCICFYLFNRKNTSNFVNVNEHSVQVTACLIGILLFMSLYFVTTFSGDNLSVLYNDSYFFTFKEDIPVLATYFIVVALFVTFGYYIIKKKCLRSLEYMMMVLCFFIIVYEAGMATGTKGLTYIIACVSIPFALCILYKVNCPCKWVKNLVLTIGCIFLCTLSLVQKYAQPYSWWGWADEPIGQEDNYSIDLPHMEGFRVSKTTKVTYEEINKLITENSEPGDFVLTFPHMKLFNIISDRMQMPTFVVSYFFDVCPDEYAIQDAKIIEQNPPKIVIMNEYDEGFWSYNENAFRGGEASGQREILNWFNNARHLYDQIGYVNGLEIYQLIENTQLNYVYYAYDGVDDVNVMPAFDYAYSIVDIGMTKLNMNEDTFVHIRNTLFLIALFFCFVLLQRKKTDLYSKALLLISTIGLFIRISPLFSLVYILVVFLPSNQNSPNAKSWLNFSIKILLWLQVITVPVTFLIDWPVLRYLRILLHLVMWILVLLKIFKSESKTSKSTPKSDAIITVICICAFLVTQIYYCETPWWGTFMCNNYFSNTDSMHFFGMICLVVWAGLMHYTNNYKRIKRGKEND